MILIIGGTSGIGWEVARQYAEDGQQVLVCGRDLAKLPSPLPESIANKVQAVACDITDLAQVQALFAQLSTEVVDLVLVSAGFYFRDRFERLDASTTLRMLNTNILGLDVVFSLASKQLVQQGFGQLAAIASVAGLLRDYPGASLYSSCKKSVIQLCDSYRIALKPFGISVTAIIPGYVDTAKLREINQQDVSKKPFLISEQQAAEHIISALAKRQAQLVFPRRMHWLIRLLNCLPAALLAKRPA